MDLSKLSRPLTAEEIGVRISDINKSYITLLLYKDARIDMSILDEAAGPLGWKREQISTVIGEGKVQMICRVSIRDEQSGEWIFKDDIGKESHFEKEKGQVSDSFKRACTNWGIGRALYSAPEISIKYDEEEPKRINISEKDGKYICYDKFRVTQLLYNEIGTQIIALAIKDVTTQKMVFVWDSRPQKSNENDNTDNAAAEKENTNKNENEKKQTKKPNKQLKANPVITKSSLTVDESSNQSDQITGQTTLPLEEQTIPNSANDNAEDVYSVEVDCGTLTKGKKLGVLTAHELVWVYQNTKKSEVKKAALKIASMNDDVKNVFISRGINC